MQFPQSTYPIGHFLPQEMNDQLLYMQSSLPLLSIYFAFYPNELV